MGPRSPHPIGTPHGMSTNTGALASAAWVAARDLVPDQQRWFIEIALGVPTETDTRLQIDLYAEEWGVQFHRAGRGSWIRVTDVVFVHGRDEHQLLPRMPPLRDLHVLVRDLEQRHNIRFDRTAAEIRTGIKNAEPIVRDWLATF